MLLAPLQRGGDLARPFRNLNPGGGEGGRGCPALRVRLPPSTPELLLSPVPLPGAAPDAAGHLCSLFASLCP